MSKLTARVSLACHAADKERWDEAWPEHGELSRVARKLLNEAAEAVMVKRRPAYLATPHGAKLLNEI